MSDLISLASIAKIDLNLLVESFVTKHRSSNTKITYKKCIDLFFKDSGISCIEDLANIPKPVMTIILRKYLESVTKRDKHAQDKVINPKTVNQKMYILSSFFNYLIAEFNYPFNPIKSIKPYEYYRKSSTESLTKKEVIELITYMREKSTKSKIDFRNYIIILFLASFASRRSELTYLKWSDVDLKNNTITFFQKGRLTKVLPIPNQILLDIKNYKNIFGKKSPYFFTPEVNNKTKDTKKPISSDLIFKIIKDITKDLFPDKNITPHSLRKSFIEIALAGNVNIVHIINATGHLNVDSIRYYDGRDSILNNAVNDLAGFLHQ